MSKRERERERERERGKKNERPRAKLYIQFEEKAINIRHTIISLYQSW